MILGVVFAKVGDTWLSVDEELALVYAIAYPIKAHVNQFLSFLLDGCKNTRYLDLQSST